MNRHQAYGIASEWGSYMSSGDPGACFYGFPCGDGRPQDADHARACIAWIDNHCLTAAALNDDPESDKADLTELRAWFATCLAVENFQ